MVRIADLLPARVRFWIYTILSTVYGIELVLDFLSPSIESKVVGVSAVLGFVLAAAAWPKAKLLDEEEAHGPPSPPPNASQP